MNRPEALVTKAALDQLTSYDWPGNIRQLQNVIERSIILWQEGPLNFDLPVSQARQDSRNEIEPSAKPALLTRDELKRQQRDAIVDSLKQTNGKVSGRGGAAELLGMKASTLGSRISSLGLKRKGTHLRILTTDDSHVPEASVATRACPISAMISIGRMDLLAFDENSICRFLTKPDFIDSATDDSAKDC